MTCFCSSSPGNLFQQSPPEFPTNVQALGSITMLTVLLAGNVQVLMLANKRPASKVLLHPHHLSQLSHCPHFLTHTRLFWLIPLPTRHHVPSHQGLSLMSKGWEVLFPTCMLSYLFCPLSVNALRMCTHNGHCLTSPACPTYCVVCSLSLFFGIKSL